MGQDMTTGGPPKSARPQRSARVGVVDSVSGAKTVRVVLSNLVKHPLYGKYVGRRSKLLVHDGKGEAQVGDTVEIVPCRPISKHKSWRMIRVLRRAAIH